MKWYAQLNTRPKAPAPAPAPAALPTDAPPQGLKTLPKTQTEQFMDWVEKYSPQLHVYLKDMENALMTEVNQKKRLKLQEIYKNTLHRKFSEWSAKMEEAQQAGKPESSVQLAVSWLDMVKIANSLDLNTDSLNIPDDSAMPPEKNKARSIPPKTPRRRIDPDHKVPGLSQDPPIGSGGK
jgi:hypothetical protein